MFQLPRLTKLIKILIVVNVVFWIIEVILLRTSFSSYVTSLFLYPNQVLSGKIWQLLTYAFFHSPSNIFHLILNMAVLYFFSYDLESKWGEKKFIFFYSFSALIGGIFVVLEGAFLIRSHYYIPTLGASASIFALTTAFALTYPQREIYFFFVPIKSKYLIHIDLAIITLSYLSISQSDISNAAHLGGMAGAFLLLKVPWFKLMKKTYKREKAVDYLRRIK